MRKYAYLVARRTHPSRILSVTFTNKAAKEMKKRASTILNMKHSDLESSWISTFHALSIRFLRDNDNYKLVGLKDDFHVCTVDEASSIIKELL